MAIDVHADTICAIATPAGDGGIGIIKISGPEALTAALKIFQPYHCRLPLQSHRLHYGSIRDPLNGQVIDEVLLSYMAAPHSYTCEDVVEINCHSGFAVLSQLLHLVLRCGARMATPGEFTRRAFLNGRIDLSQAEAVIDVIRSSSEQSLRIANAQLQGELRRKAEQWRGILLDLEAQIEAHIDFSDDMEDELLQAGSSLADRMQVELIGPISEAIATYESGRIMKDGLTMVLVGKPNVGKSSLLNGLLGDDRAIVTQYPGTTRDVIEESFLLSGIRVRILDTAGIRHNPDHIEAVGIERTLRSLEKADFALWMVDQSCPLTEEDDLVFRCLADRRYIVILNKADLPVLTNTEAFHERYQTRAFSLSLSALSDGDIQRLRDALSDHLLHEPLRTSESAIIASLRHKSCLEAALQAVERAASLALGESDIELVSIELHQARAALELLLGLTWSDDLLDRIFSQFCIGK